MNVSKANLAQRVQLLCASVNRLIVFICGNSFCRIVPFTVLLAMHGPVLQAQSKPDIENSGSAAVRGSPRGASVQKKLNEELKLQLSQMREAMERAEFELEEVQAELVGQTNDLNRSESYIDSSTREIKRLEQSLDDFQQKTHTLEDELAAARSSMSLKDTEMEEFQSSLDSNISRSGVLERSLDRANRELDALRDKMQAMEGLQKQNDQLNATLSQEQESNSGLRQRNYELTEALTNVNEQNDMLADRIEASDTANSQTRAEVANVQKESDLLSNQLENEIQALQETSSKLAAVENELVAAEQDYNLSRAKAAELKRHSESRAVALQASEQEAAELQQKLGITNADLDRLNEEFALLQQSFNDQQSASGEQGGQVEKSLAALRMANEELTNKSAEVAELENELTQSNLRVERVTAQVDDLNAKLSVVSAANAGADNEAITGLQSVLDEKESLIAEYEEIIDELNKKMDSINTSVVDVNAFDELKEEVDSLVLERTQLEQALAKSEQANEDITQQRGKLEAEFSESREALDSKDRELDEVNEQLAMVDQTDSSTADPEPVEPVKPADQIVSGTGDNPVYALGGGWGVAVSSIGPVDYISYEQANSIIAELPQSEECALFAEGFVVDDGLEKKLVVNGFPVMGFWVRKGKTRLGMCRVTESVTGEFRASVGRQNPARLDSAIKPIQANN